jgi:hypothetical protein
MKHLESRINRSREREERKFRETRRWTSEAV